MISTSFIVAEPKELARESIDHIASTPLEDTSIHPRPRGVGELFHQNWVFERVAEIGSE